MITIMGASGHTGAKIAEALLNAGEKVRAVGRTESKLAAFSRAGADVWIGDAADSMFLTNAFRGADAVYTLVAPDPSSADYRAAQDEQGAAIATAIRDSGVRHVVALSSLGADRAEPFGVIAGLRAQEERLRRLSHAHVTILRPASFFENLESAPGLIKELGLVGDAVTANLPIPMVATRDIADIATAALRSRDWNGIVVRELLGPRDISYSEATRLLGEKIGKPDLTYVQFPDDEMMSAMVTSGLSQSFAALYVEMTRAINAQQLQPQNGRSLANRTPTRFEEFVDELARTYQAM